MPSLVQFEQLYDSIKKTYFQNYFFEIIAKFRMKTNFFPRQDIAKILFALDSIYTGNIPYQVWFNLNNSMTLSKRPIFKITYLK